MPYSRRQLFHEISFFFAGERGGTRRRRRLADVLLVERPEAQKLQPFERQIQIAIAEFFLERPARGGALLCGEHLVHLFPRQLVDGQSRRHGRNEFAPKPVYEVAIAGGEKSFADQWQAVKPAERFNHDIRSEDVFLEIVEQRVAGLEKFLSIARFEEILPLISPRDLAHEVFALQDDRKLIGFMVAAERLVADGNGEKTGEAVGLIVAGGFQIAPQRLRAHVDAKDRLGLGPDADFVVCAVGAPGHRRISAGGNDGCAAELKPEFLKQLCPVARFESFEPYRTMLGLGETVDPFEQQLQVRCLCLCRAGPVPNPALAQWLLSAMRR